MLSVALSERVFESDIRQKIKDMIEEFHWFEFYYKEDSLYYSLEEEPMSRKDLEYIISDVFRKPYINTDGSCCQSSTNQHHIISNKGFVIQDKKLVVKYNSRWQDFIDFHQISCHQWWEHIRWADNEANKIPMTINRHNKWLNIRYPWNMLPHHQLLSELDQIQDMTHNVSYQKCKAIKILYELLHESYFEELYRKESYIIQ